MKISIHVFWCRANADSFLFSKFIYNFGFTVVGIKPPLPEGMRKATEIHLHIPIPPMQLTIRIDLFWKEK